MKSPTKNVQVAVRLTPAEKRELARLVRRLRDYDNVSDFCRDAIREKVAREAAKKPNGGQEAA